MNPAKLALLLLVWMAGLFLIVQVALPLPYEPTFPYAWEILPRYQSRLLTTWLQFDGVHYLTIIDRGYVGIGLIQAFFPFYPLLVKWFSLGVFEPVIVGIIVSVISLSLGIHFLYRLVLLDEQVKTAKRTLGLLLFFPTAFFLIALYTESLFLLLVITSFYAARKNKWWVAGILGFLASTTRLIGIALLPALLVEYWLQRKKITSDIIWCFGPLLGLLIYMSYLWITFDDPLLFYHVQAEFGANRADTGLVLLPQVYYRYLKMILTTDVNNPIYPILIQELMAGIGGLMGLIICWKKIRKSYVIFGIGAFLLPTLTGTFSSMPRYLLPIFPLFMLVAKSLSKKAYIIVLILSAVMLIYNVIRFTKGLWVA